MKRVIIIFLFSLIINSSIAQDYKYELLDKNIKSDLPLITYKKIDEFLGDEELLLKKVFQPIQGKYEVFRFICKMKINNFENFSSDRIENIEKYIYDLIIVKVEDSVIIDGYRFPLYWSEMPSKAGLFRLTKPIPIDTCVPIQSLLFKPVYKIQESYLDTNFKQGNLYF